MQQLSFDNFLTDRERNQFLALLLEYKDNDHDNWIEIWSALFRQYCTEMEQDQKIFYRQGGENSYVLITKKLPPGTERMGYANISPGDFDNLLDPDFLDDKKLEIARLWRKIITQKDVFWYTLFLTRIHKRACTMDEEAYVLVETKYGERYMWISISPHPAYTSNAYLQL